MRGVNDYVDKTMTSAKKFESFSLCEYRVFPQISRRRLCTQLSTLKFHHKALFILTLNEMTLNRSCSSFWNLIK